MVFQDRPDYRSYLLRLWRATSAGQPMWRASLQDIATGERRGFTDLQSLFAYLEEQAGGREVDRPGKNAT